jgi:pimeloyl-ACP methyl ester carboxylesterase
MTLVENPVAFRGADLVVRSTGVGRTVGYLHGPLGVLSGNAFVRSLADSAGVRVVAPELPGFGGSAPCADLRTIYDWTAATSEILDLCGLVGETVVASSLGAMLALEVAAIRPEAFGHLVLIAPLGLWVDDDPITDTLGATMRQQRELLTADVGATAAFFEDDTELAVPDQVNQRVERYVARSTAAGITWPIPEFGLDTRLHLVRCPVTLIWGSDDRVVPVGYLERFAASLKNVRSTHIVAGAGHLAEWDRPAEVATIVREATP